MLEDVTITLLRGMKRSGNHVVAQWLCSLSGSCFVNNIIHVEGLLQDGIPLLPPPQSRSAFLRHHRKKHRCTHLFRHLASLEDIAVDHEPFTGRRSRSILVIRNPFNMFASRLRKGLTTGHRAYPQEWGPQFSYQVSLWKDYARATLDPQRRDIRATIVFDHFLHSETHQQEVCSRLHLPHRAPDLSRIPEFGGGSSFSGTPDETPAEFSRSVSFRMMDLTSDEASIIQPLLEDSEVHELWAKVKNRYA